MVDTAGRDGLKPPSIETSVVLADLFTNPDTFFEGVAEDSGLLRPAAVVALLGIVSALGTVPVTQATMSALPPDAGAFAAVFSAIGAIFAFVFAFVVWALYAAAFHGISALAFDPEGSFTDTLAVTGWGFAPGVVGGLVSAVISVYAYQGVDFPSDPAQIQTYAAQLQNRPIFLAAFFVGVVFLLWQAFLWTFGVRHARDLTLREAAITVAVPVAVAILIRLGGRFL